MHLSKLACDGLRTYTVRKREDVVYEKPLDGPESQQDAITMARALPAYTLTYEWTDEEVAAETLECAGTLTAAPPPMPDVTFDSDYLQKAIQELHERARPEQPKYVGTISDIPVYTHPAVPEDKLVVVDPKRFKVQPLSFDLDIWRR